MTFHCAFSGCIQLCTTEAILTDTGILTSVRLSFVNNIFLQYSLFIHIFLATFFLKEEISARKDGVTLPELQRHGCKHM